MTRIQQQEQTFRESIQFDGWTIIDRTIYRSSVSDVFRLYHDVTFDYYTETDKEKFVKKWWSKVMDPSYKIEDIKRSIPLNKKIIHQQRAVYSIDWESSAWKIVDKVSDLFENKLRYID